MIAVLSSRAAAHPEETAAPEEALWATRLVEPTKPIKLVGFGQNQPKPDSDKRVWVGFGVWGQKSCIKPWCSTGS